MRLLHRETCADARRRMPRAALQWRASGRRWRRTDRAARRRPSRGHLVAAVPAGSRPRRRAGTSADHVVGRDVPEPVAGHAARSSGGRQRSQLDTAGPEAIAEESAVKDVRPVDVERAELIAAEPIADGVSHRPSRDCRDPACPTSLLQPAAYRAPATAY